MRLFDARDRISAPPPPAVRVNGREIFRAMITREIQNHPAESPMAARGRGAPGSLKPFYFNDMGPP